MVYVELLFVPLRRLPKRDICRHRLSRFRAPARLAVGASLDLLLPEFADCLSSWEGRGPASHAAQRHRGDNLILIPKSHQPEKFVSNLKARKSKAPIQKKGGTNHLKASQSVDLETLKLRFRV